MLELSVRGAKFRSSHVGQRQIHADRDVLLRRRALGFLQIFVNHKYLLSTISTCYHHCAPRFYLSTLYFGMEITLIATPCIVIGTWQNEKQPRGFNRGFFRARGVYSFNYIGIAGDYP